jgi:hypothetical protein
LTPIMVTFDSNVWECIADSAKLEAHAEAKALQRIRAAIVASEIRPYICDVVITLEGIRKQDRAGFFANVKTISTSSEPVVERIEDGIAHISRKIKMHASFEHFPLLHKKLSTALLSAFALGFRLINVPRVGWMRVDDGLYKPLPIDQCQLIELHNKIVCAAEAFEKAGCGVAWVMALGNDALRAHPELSQLNIHSPLIAFAHSDDQPAVPGAVAEWADGDALAAHHGHGHDVFCSLDRGVGAGTRSVLYQGRRKWLEDEFAIKVRTPTEVAKLLP